MHGSVLQPAVGVGQGDAGEYHFLGAELRPDDLGDFPHPVPEHLQAVPGKPEIPPVFHPP